jgi:phage replication-related protein YjqB (UPF0714/DUF867 family)
MGETAVRIRSALAAQTTLREGRHRGEHCAVFSTEPGNLLQGGEQYQVRMRRAPAGNEYVLYTVSETHGTVEGEDVVHMGADGRARLGGSGAAVLETQVTHPILTDKEAAKEDEFVERVTGSGVRLIAIAPHGGEIEPKTDAQAARVAALFGREGRCWVCKGWGQGGGAAYRRWHITSAEISERSFPRLRALMRVRFEQAVAFHGWDLPYIGVGGRADAALKQRVRWAIEAAVEGSVEVLLDSSSGFSGTSKRNIVNRLAASGRGLHIEQPLGARQEYWEAIADAVGAELIAGGARRGL